MHLFEYFTYKLKIARPRSSQTLETWDISPDISLIVTSMKKYPTNNSNTILSANSLQNMLEFKFYENNRLIVWELVFKVANKKIL